MSAGSRARPPRIRRGVLVLALVSVLGVGGLWAGMSWESGRADVYEARAVVLVSPLQGNPFNPSGRCDDPANLETEAQLVKSDVMAELVAQTLGDDATPEQILSGVSVAVPPNTQLLEISARMTSEEESVAKAQTFAGVYLQFRRARTESAISDQSARVEEQIRARESERQTRVEELDETPPRSARSSLVAQLIINLTDEIAELNAQLGDLRSASLDPGQIVNPATARRAGLPGGEAAAGGLGFLAGTALGLILVVGLGRLRGTVNQASDLDACGATLLGSLAIDESPKASGTRLGARSTSASRLRSAVLAATAARPLTVLISGVDDDAPGRSDTAEALAGSFAAANLRTVIVEMGAASTSPDRRGSTRHASPGTASVDLLETASEGVAELLTREHADLSLTLVEEAPYLHVLPRGGVRSLDDLVATPGMDQLLQQLRERFDVVLIDGGSVEDPPAQALAMRADLVLVGVRGGRTTRRSVEWAIDDLHTLGAPGVGLVLCGRRRRRRRDIDSASTAGEASPSREDPERGALPGPGFATGNGAGGVTPHLGSLARGGALGMIGSMVAAVAGFGLAVAVTRAFVASEAGLFFAVVAIFSVLVVICVLGADAGFARFLLRLEAEGRHADVRRTLVLALGPAIALSGLVVAVVLLVGEDLSRLLGLGPQGAVLLRTVIIALPFAVAAELLLAATRALGRIRTTVYVDRLLRAGVQPVVALVVIVMGGTLVDLVVGWAAVYGLSAAVALVALLRFLRRRPAADGPAASPEPHLGRRFWGFTWARGVAAVAQVAVQKIDIILVAALLTPVDAAIYAAATRFVVVGQMANQAIHQVLAPRFTAIMISEDNEVLREVHRIATSWGILLIWPIYLVVASAPMLYLSFFGDRYQSAGAVVLVMAVAMMVAVTCGPTDTMLLMAGRSRLSMGNAWAALLVDVVLCVTLIPAIGILGAAAAWAAAVLVRNGLAVLQMKRSLGLTVSWGVQMRVAVRPLLCFVVPVWAYTSLTDGALVGWLGIAVLAGVVYLFSLRWAAPDLHLDILVGCLRGVRLRRPVVGAGHDLPLNGLKTGEAA